MACNSYPTRPIFRRQIAGARQVKEGTSAETAFNGIPLPKAVLQGGYMFRYWGGLLVQGVNGTDELVVRCRLGGLAGLELFATGSVNPTEGDVVTFDGWANLLSAKEIATATHFNNFTPAVLFGGGYAAEQDPLFTSSADLVVTEEWNATSAADLTTLFELGVEVFEC